MDSGVVGRPADFGESVCHGSYSPRALSELAAHGARTPRGTQTAILSAVTLESIIGLSAVPIGRCDQG